MPPVSGDWILEVSSPGLERKLSKPEHFAKSISEMAKIILSDKSEIVGTIVSANGDDIVINDGTQNINLNFNNIKKAKTFIPKNGEIIVYDADETHLRPRIKIGDGIKTVGNLDFITDESSSMVSGKTIV